VNHKLESIATLLDAVRWQRDRHAFRAKCPVHGGGADTLSIRIHPARDQLQVHCFAGCGALAVLDALGLAWSAIYPDRPTDNRIRKLPPPPHRDALVGIDHEAHVVAIVAGRMESGHQLTRADLDRLTLAANRINAARAIARIR
jgi:hypothetical protein